MKVEDYTMEQIAIDGNEFYESVYEVTNRDFTTSIILVYPPNLNPIAYQLVVIDTFDRFTGSNIGREYVHMEVKADEAV